VLVPVETVRKLAEGILLANGVPEVHARTQAGLFLEAEMRAIDRITGALDQSFPSVQSAAE